MDGGSLRCILLLDHSSGTDRQGAGRAGQGAERRRRPRAGDFRSRRLLRLDRAVLRFARSRVPVVDGISEHGYGVYFYHYPIVLWLQYALLDLLVPGVAKGMPVLVGTALASWGLSVLTERVLAACRPALTRAVLLLGAELGVDRTPHSGSPR